MGEVLKLCLSVIKKEKWGVKAIYVKTAYLKGKNIERSIVVREGNRETMEAEEGSKWPLGNRKDVV